MTIYASKIAFIVLGLEQVAPSNAHMYQDCYICKDPLDVNIHTKASAAHHSAVRIRGCGHMHGQDCLNAWLDAGNSCPTCKHILFDPCGHTVSEADITSVMRNLRHQFSQGLIISAIARFMEKRKGERAELHRAHDEELKLRKAKEARSHQDTLMDDKDWAESGEEDFDMEEDVDGDFVTDD
ncbi:hypothetical protein EJ07DRAFT_88490, partial [Lizonia empirigonia]